MAVFDRQRSRQRRVDPRKIRGESLRGQLAEWSQPRYLRRLAVMVFFFVGCMVLMHLPYEPIRHHVGETTAEPIRSRVEFSTEDRQATRQKREEARLKAPAVYVPDPTYVGQLRSDFAALIAAAKAAVPPESARPPLPATSDSAVPPTGTALPATTATPAAPESAAPALSPEEKAAAEKKAAEEARRAEEAKKAAEAQAAAQKKVIEAWGYAGDQAALAKIAENSDKLRKDFDAITAQIDALPILSDADYSRESVEKRSHIYVFKENIFESFPTTSIYNANSRAAEDKIREIIDKAMAGPGVPPTLPDRLAARAVAVLGPDLVYNEKLTADKRDEAAATVGPVMQTFRKGDEIVAEGVTIGPPEYERLQVEHSRYLAEIPWYVHVCRLGGSAVMLIMLLVLLAVYTRLWQREIAERAIRAFLLAALFLLVLAIAKFSYSQFRRPMVVFPLTTAAMIVTIAYNRRYAMFVTWTMIFAIALATQLELNDVLLLVIGTSVAVLQIDEIRNRSKLIRVGFVTGLVFLVVIWAEEMWLWRGDFDTPDQAWGIGRESAFALAFGLLPGFVILGILPFIERLFNVVTSISLLELCDVNQPALRALAINAPGTYSHSLLLGSLVEPAAEAIGANGLLARVGAYFHDIGKANKPNYFTENQGQLANMADHSNLTPQMSKLIITGHIKDGLDMARQYGLPRAVNAFIAEHHGTTIIEYFYHEARKATDGAAVAETEFRYPGPKPHSRETAILMMADSCEGAVRAIKEPTPTKIEDRVHEIIMKRLLDGQFNESGLTLNDVWMVEQSLTKSLISVYHGRIAYPSEEESAATKAARSPNGNGTAPVPNQE